jgi:dihydropteroate synthase
MRLADGRKLRFGQKTLVMGVLNVTPDSFSDGGHYFSPDAAIGRGAAMASEGADLIDIGGESTRPNASPVSAREELRRVIPVLRSLVEDLKVPISIDTRKAEVAKAALDAGATIVNDVGGLRSRQMRTVIRERRAAAIVMHMRGTPATMQEDTTYRDLQGEVLSYLRHMTDLAVGEGVSPDLLMVDPGLGFGKSAQGNLDLLVHAHTFRELGYPVVIGASRKSFLGAATGGLPVTARLEASLAAAVIAAMEGADIVRVHDVAPTVKALKVVDLARASLG